MAAALIECPTPAGRLRVRLADSFVTRALGLLAGAPLAPDEALLIAPCSSIHTFGMRYAIDVLFLDRAGLILRVAPDVRAGRARFGFGARAVLEVRSGVAARQGLAPGAMLPALAEALAR
jgi:uncharacterized membrane protein (UPF0127 family)